MYNSTTMGLDTITFMAKQQQKKKKKTNDDATIKVW